MILYALNLVFAAVPLLVVFLWAGSILIDRAPWWWLPVRFEFWLMAGVAFLLLQLERVGVRLPLGVVAFVGEWQQAIHEVMASLD